MMLSILVTLFLILLIYLLVKFLWEMRDLPPGPWGLPILGSLLRLCPTEPHQSLTLFARKYGPIYSIQMGRVLTVVISDPAIIREALSKEEFSGRADLYLTHGIMQGYGIVCAEGRWWKEQRIFVSSTLKSLGMVKIGARRERLQERIMEGVDETIHYLKTQDGREVDACRTLLHSVGNVMNSLVYGHRYSWEDPTWRWLQHLAEDGVKHIGVAGPLNFLPFLSYLPKYQRTMNFLLDGKHKTHEVYQRLIDSHPVGRDDDFIAAFLKEQQTRGAEPGSFTTPQFYHLLADLFGAGVDTTLTTLRWLLIYLAMHLDVQTRVQKDLDVVCGESPPLLQHLPELPYLQAAIAEAQRIRPVVPLGIPHGAVQDGRLGGYRIPRGTMVVPLQWAVHMDPHYWQHPDNFDPDRFLDKEGKFFRPDAFLPFQSGKRVCVGEELARMLLFLYSANLLKTFTVNLPPGCQNPLDFECGITLTPKLKKLHFTPRTSLDIRPSDQ